MTLKEAIESGLPFKISNSVHWFGGEGARHPADEIFSMQDVTRTDWTIKREAIVVECRWGKDVETLLPAYAVDRAKILKVLDKKCRVTIEVIE